MKKMKAKYKDLGKNIKMAEVAGQASCETGFKEIFLYSELALHFYLWKNSITWLAFENDTLVNIIIHAKVYLTP